MKIFSVFAVMVCIASQSFAAPAEVKVIDGDSIVVNGHETRLSGIDAPEYFQICYDGAGQPYECGKKATDFMRQLLKGKEVKCETLTIDRYHREVAVCTANGTDINQEMVEQGWAVSYSRYTHNYDAAEQSARAAKRGIWQGRFMKPELYRALKR